VTLSEEDGVRYLHFGTEWIQGGMRIARPWQLELEYQRQMLDLFTSEGVSWTRWNLARGGGFGLLQGTGTPTAEAMQLTAALQSTP